MSYTPTSWSTGDTITAAAMNKIENGIANAGGALIVTSTFVNSVQQMDKTVQEIYDALMSGTPVYYTYHYGVPGTDYETYAWFAPITYIYTYNVANVIRVVVNRPHYHGAGATGSSGNYVLAPSVMLFEATALNDYPKYYRTVVPTAASTYSYDGFIL